MQIQVNGEPREAPEAFTVQALLEELGITGGRIAVEVNADIVPRSEHARHALQDGDRIEVVHAIGGG
jgi:sulfur carrier protein